MLYSMQCADVNVLCDTGSMSAQDIWLPSIMDCGRNLRRTRKVHSAPLCGSGWYTIIAKCHDTQSGVDVGYLSELVCF